MHSHHKTGWPAACLSVGLTVLLLNGQAIAQDSTDELVEQGRVIYEETAGGVGCATCHAHEGTGDPEVGGPYIRGVNRSAYDAALNGAVREMEFLDLSVPEREAVFAYLQYLDLVTLDPVAEAGKVIFEEKAGGVGCATCHGETARGLPDVGAPNIQGKDSVAILEQLRTNEQMQFIELSQQEVDQVAAYLRYLHDLQAH